MSFFRSAPVVDDDDLSFDHPLHVAIIMDGNGRWAAARGWPRTLGHREGIKAVQRTLKAAKTLPIGCITLYSFSSENWRRPEDEISELMNLLRTYLRQEVPMMQKEGIRLRVIGSRAELPRDIVDQIAKAEADTAQNTAFTLVLALNYGGQQEIAQAAQMLAQQVADGVLAVADITVERVAQALYTYDLPNPDLVIRTSGEQRISNFLLWQSAYAEYVFPDVLWPDFSEDHLRQALKDFKKRNRRFGGT